MLPQIQSNKRASKLLVSYLNIDWPWHPLLYFKKYLAEQVGGVIKTQATSDKEPPAEKAPPAEPSEPPVPAVSSSNGQTSLAYPGERYPQTRQRLLTMAEVEAFSFAQLRYAINEMYARHGASFPSQPPIEAQFRKFPWYHPNPQLTTEQIEASFTDVERENLELMGKERDLKRR